MKKIAPFLIAATIIIAGISSALAAGKEADAPWSVRCEGEEQKVDKGRCEMFQRLVLKENGMRVAEMAIGFPSGKKDARGALILPLGMMLAEGAQMKIDDGQLFKFNIRYCLKDGCYAFLNLNEKLLGLMRKGKTATIIFKMLDGKEAVIPLSLSGFTKAVEQIS